MLQLKLIHLFASELLLMKKLEIEKTKPTFVISVLKVAYYLGGLSFFDFQLFLLVNIPREGNSALMGDKIII